MRPTKELFRLSKYNSTCVDVSRIDSIRAAGLDNPRMEQPKGTINIKVAIVYNNSGQEVVYTITVKAFGKLKKEMDKGISSQLGIEQRAFPDLAVLKIIKRMQPHWA